MWLNCKRAEVNSSAGRLESHFRGIIEDVSGPLYHVSIGAMPVCGTCGVILLAGQVASVLGDGVYHAECCPCTCGVHVPDTI